MRSTDERVSAVRRRSSRLRRRRGNRMIAALVCLLALPLADLVGKQATGGSPAPSASSDGLFGAASLLGSSVGGYVLVATIAVVIAVAVTVVLMKRRSSRNKDGEEGRRQEHSSLDHGTRRDQR